MTPKAIEQEVSVKASSAEVWRAWTTVAGVKTFFAPEARIDLRPGGAYEILFDLDSPAGKKGSEGSKILSFVPERMLSFTWGAPPKFPGARREIAQWVVLLFDPEEGGRTRVRLFELGFKPGKEGEAVRRYFVDAWDLVLQRLAHCFETGRIDWERPWRPGR
jgi:uncharacterized protein YndB with AHSA1/START domain